MADLRCFILSPAPIMKARVNMAGAITYPLDEITYDTVTLGSDAFVWAEMTLLLGTTDGADDLGRQRLRLRPSSTKFFVGRSSIGTRDGELTVQDNAYITIVNDHRVWAKIPFIDSDGDIFKDGLSPGFGRVLNPPPIANGGVARAGTINSGTGLLTLSFSASESRQFDAAVSSALSTPPVFHWFVDDGTITVGSNSTANITVTFPAGFRYVRLTVESDAGIEHIAMIPVFARDPADDDSFTEFQVVNHRYADGGWEMSLRILADIPRATYPDGTLVMVWEGEPSSASDVSNIRFIGWHQSDNGDIHAQRSATLRDVTLHCVDVVGRLKRLPGFPQLVEAVEVPGKWTQTRYPNVFYYLWYLLYWHSTAVDVGGLLLGTQILNNFDFKLLSSDAGNLYDQANSLASNVTPDHYLTCNHWGQMMLVVDQMIQNVADRSATILDELDDTDWTDITYSGERPPRVYKLLSYAVAGGVAEIIPLAALAPGEAEGQGGSYIETSERITDGQFDLNNVEGNRYARLNARYGLFTITLPYARLAAANDPAVMGWVELTVTGSNQPQRPLPFTTARGLVREMTFSYDYQRTGLVRTAILTWEMETSGPPAVTVELEVA